MNNKSKKFKKIYYIIQTTPIFKTCGYAFSKQTADFVAEQVLLLTGQRGKVVEFDREELKDLNFKKYAESKNTKR